ncbi:hypothetical protein [Yoonia tamlensis]|nr:hypothetical protein [Yoonia tamlensis]
MKNTVETRLSLATRVERHRKQTKYRLVAAVMLGGLIGYHSSPFFENLLISDPDHPGFPLNSWEGMREMGIAILTVHGIFIWPVVLLVIDHFIIRRSGAKLAAEVAIADTQAQLERAAETQRRIAAAKDRGLI